MEILIEDIPEEGLEVLASEKEKWFAVLVQDAVGAPLEGDDHACLKVRIHRIDGNVELEGRVDLTAHQLCDRCLGSYRESRKIPFHAVLAPLYESERQREMEKKFEVELVKEDLEFGYYEGDSFDLGEVVREQIVLEDPMKHLCKEDCKGICQRCGKDLNEGPCECKGGQTDPHWAPLKGLKCTSKK